MQELFFEFKVDFKVDLKSRLNLMSCLKDQGFFKIRLNPSFLTTMRIELDHENLYNYNDEDIGNNEKNIIYEDDTNSNDL